MQTDKLNLKGVFNIEHIRNGKVIDKFEIKNTVVTDGKNNLFNIMFGGSTQITSWYIGIIDNASFSTIAVTDTMAAHSGWLENAGYSETTRQQWSPGSASSGSITNGTAATFTVNATGTLRGIFVTSVSTKSGTTGVLWSGVTFASTVSVVSGDSIKITYTVSA